MQFQLDVVRIPQREQRSTVLVLDARVRHPKPVEVPRPILEHRAVANVQREVIETDCSVPRSRVVWHGTEPLSPRQVLWRAAKPRMPWQHWTPSSSTAPEGRKSRVLPRVATQPPQRRDQEKSPETKGFSVGDEGFEPPTPCASCRCSNQLS